jgi:hypothetical protein
MNKQYKTHLLPRHALLFDQISFNRPQVVRPAIHSLKLDSMNRIIKIYWIGSNLNVVLHLTFDFLDLRGVVELHCLQLSVRCIFLCFKSLQTLEIRSTIRSIA